MEGARGPVDASEALGALQGSEPELRLYPAKIAPGTNHIRRKHEPEFQPCLPHVGFCSLIHMRKTGIFKRANCGVFFWGGMKETSPSSSAQMICHK